MKKLILFLLLFLAGQNFAMASVSLPVEPASAKKEIVLKKFKKQKIKKLNQDSLTIAKIGLYIALLGLLMCALSTLFLADVTIFFVFMIAGILIAGIGLIMVSQGLKDSEKKE